MLSANVCLLDSSKHTILHWHVLLNISMKNILGIEACCFCFFLYFFLFFFVLFFMNGIFTPVNSSNCILIVIISQFVKICRGNYLNK